MSKTISGDTSSAGDADPHSGHGKAKKSALVIGSLGVVFGDIGTSPLYAIKESFHDHGAGHLQVTSTNVTGLLSLVLWFHAIGGLPLATARRIRNPDPYRGSSSLASLGLPSCMETA